LETVTKIAKLMVTKYGMSNLGILGIFYLFYFKDFENLEDLSSETKHNIEKEVKSIVDVCYNNVKEIITKKKKNIEKVANVLLDYETLSGSEFLSIINGQTIRSKETLIKY
jgi:ATP-dependent Zn protease